MEKLEVLYNAECPICRREIEHYERLSGDDVDYVRITPDTALDWGLTEDQAAEKLHARARWRCGCGGGGLCRDLAAIALFQTLGSDCEFQADQSDIIRGLSQNFGPFVICGP